MIDKLTGQLSGWLWPRCYYWPPSQKLVFKGSFWWYGTEKWTQTSCLIVGWFECEKWMFFFVKMTVSLEAKRLTDKDNRLAEKGNDWQVDRSIKRVVVTTVLLLTTESKTCFQRFVLVIRHWEMNPDQLFNCWLIRTWEMDFFFYENEWQVDRSIK